MRYRDVIDLDSHGRSARVTLEYGVVPARLPDIPDRLLNMVVVRGFGKRPMMLLTSLAKTTSREALWQVVEGYITRWRVENTIRFVKQSYNLEDIRLVKYAKLRNRTAIVLVAVYFARTWLGNSEQRQVIASHVARMSLRIHEIPELHFYAIADGIRAVCSWHGKWHASTWRRHRATNLTSSRSSPRATDDAPDSDTQNTVPDGSQENSESPRDPERNGSVF